MAIYEVFSRPLLVKYKTSVCSKTTCFYIVTDLLLFICPFIITYYSQGFWRKIDAYREQPDVLFKHKMLLVLETKSAEQLMFWSTYEKLNRLINHEFLQVTPSVEHREYDFDRDGKKDELQMTIDIPLSRQEVISVKLILVFDYKLYLYSDFHMECAAYIQHSASVPGSALSVFGELSLTQREPLKHVGEDIRYNVPVIDVSKVDQPPTSLENILLEYLRRNITASLRNEYPVWQTGYAVNESFKLNVVILYPEETVLYKVGFWELLKWALVQYMAVFTIFSYLLQKLKIYVFQKQLLPSIVIDPMKKDH